MSVLDTHARCLAGWLVSLGRHEKRVILAVSDFLLLNLALWLAMSVRIGELFFPTSWDLFVVLGAAPFIGIATFFQMGVYRLVTRFIGGRGAALTAAAVGLSGLYWGLLVHLSGVYSVPRSVVLFYPVLATAFIWGSRQVAASFLRSAGVAVPAAAQAGTQEQPQQVLIYGAETTGMQLLEALLHDVGGGSGLDHRLWISESDVFRSENA
jgi:FlaA1/EpsC-like NDP-sugar epimerase